MRTVTILLLLTGLSLAAGCASFDHDWARAAKEPTSNSLQGCWAGTWLSDANGHNGDLRCVLTLRDDGTYSARFHAIYGKVLGFGYTVHLKASETNGVFEFSGEADLHWWAGGVYHYDGYAHGNHFFSTYRCKYDHGVFQMKRLVDGAAGTVEQRTQPRLSEKSVSTNSVFAASFRLDRQKLAFSVSQRGVEPCL